MKKAVILILLAGLMTGTFIVSSVVASDQDNSYRCDQRERHGMRMGERGNDAPCVNDSNGSMGSMMHQRGQGHMMGQGMGHMNMMDSDSGHMMNHNQRMGSKHMMGDRMGQMMYLDQAKALGLNDDQVSKLKAVHSDCRKDIIRLMADIKIARLELEDLLDGNSWTVKQADPLVRKVQQLEGDLHLRQLRGISDARQVLTVEQLKQAQSGTDNLESLFE